MKYEWDPKLLHKLAKDPIAKEELSEMFKTHHTLFNDFYIPKKDDLAYDALFLLENPFIEEIIENYVKIMDCQYLPLQEYHQMFSKDDILKTTAAFYSTVDSTLYKPFTELYEQRFDHFRFTSSMHSMVFSGFTFHSPSCGETFISVDYDKTITNILATIHEYAHAIWFALRDNTEDDDKDNIFCEVESIFMELIALDYLEKNYPDYRNEVNNMRIDFYNSLINDLATLRYKLIFADEITHTKKELSGYSFLVLLLMLMKKNQMSLKDVISILQIPADTVCLYPIGGLIATELYSIYQQNPNEAIKLYKKICYLQNESDDNTIIYNQIKKMGINPSENAQILKRKIHLP